MTMLNQPDYLLKIIFLKKKNYQTLIDICTGSGCIAITLKKHLNITVDACDISLKALELAEYNALENDTKINFFETDILKSELEKKYDCIVSNPPYVTHEEITSIETKYEPSIALYANNFGLEFYERILNIAKTNLNENGTIIFEIGATQKNAITNMAKNLFPKAKITTLKDYNNFDRIMFIET